ncbi:MAG TPA: efflux RND transporter permease subunit, partial [Methylophilaceae bacterium]|nr:efflux RND transporter permease subunit [Methylophilaceae bacterium]
MLNSIIDASLRYKLLVIILFVVVAGLGIRAWQKVPVDAFPDVTPVQVNVYTESPGLASEDVEQLLSFPIESALAGLPKVQEIRSVSLFGLSYVAVYFEDDMDIYFARRLVAERLQEVGDRLPAGYGTPEMGPNTSGLGQVFWYTVERADEQLQADKLKTNTLKNPPSDMELRTLQDWSIRLILRTAAGVDDVMSWGGQERQYQIVLDPQAFAKYGLTFKEVLEVVGVNNRQVGGQYVDIGQEQFLIRGLALIKNETELGQIVVKTVNGTPVYLRDIAKIQQGGALRTGAVTRDGKEVVLGMALARVGENAKNVVDAVKAKLTTAKQTLPEGVAIRTVYERTDLVNKAIDTAIRALVEGSILVAIVLFLFLGEVRSALVVVAALPLAMLMAFICMDQAGLSANLMSLAGLAIGIGMMVDGAVVMVENSFRIMAERLEHGGAVNRTQAVLTAAREVANPMAFAILIIIVVFLPLFSLQGLEGKMFKPMAFSISFAMAGSLILALTLIPVLAALFLKPKAERDTLLMRVIKQRYLPLLEWVLAHKKAAGIISVVLLTASLALFPFLGKEFMPQL